MNNAEWPPDSVVRLRALKREGKDPNEIAAALGYSRSAVLGKLWRLGISGKAGDCGPPPRRELRRLRPGATTLPPLASLG